MRLPAKKKSQEVKENERFPEEEERGSSREIIMNTTERTVLSC